MKLIKVFWLVVLFTSLSFLGGYMIGLENKPLKLCADNDLVFFEKGHITGCIKYRGEYCTDSFNGRLERIPDGVFYG